MKKPVTTSPVKQRRRRALGLTAVELALAAVPVLLVGLLLLDVIAVEITRWRNKWALTAVAERVKREPDLSVDLWNTSDPQVLSRYRAARQRVLNGIIGEGAMPGVSFLRVKHVDKLASGDVIDETSSPIAFLPPGTSAFGVNDDYQTNIHNSYYCNVDVLNANGSQTLSSTTVIACPSGQIMTPDGGCGQVPTCPSDKVWDTAFNACITRVPYSSSVSSESMMGSAVVKCQSNRRPDFSNHRMTQLTKIKGIELVVMAKARTMLGSFTSRLLNGRLII